MVGCEKGVPHNVGDDERKAAKHEGGSDGRYVGECGEKVVVGEMGDQSCDAGERGKAFVEEKERMEDYVEMDCVADESFGERCIFFRHFDEIVDTARETYGEEEKG